MTLNCNNTNLKRGSNGEKVKEAQNLLHSLNYYNGKIDGQYGDLTVNAVKSFQKAQKTLAVDGVLGPVTCKKLQQATPTSSNSYYRNGIYHSGQHWIGKGCNKIAQCTSYYCACCSIKQQDTKQDIDNYTQQKIASMAGTTTAGTSHNGIETALYQIAKQTGKSIKVEWKNFSDLGSTINERFEALGKIIATQNKGVILHTLFKNRYGHFETIQEVNMNNKTCTILNSLGSKCNPGYCGYIETRSFSELARNLAGISQKSVCIITYN